MTAWRGLDSRTRAHEGGEFSEYYQWLVLIPSEVAGKLDGKLNDQYQWLVLIGIALSENWTAFFPSSARKFAAPASGSPAVDHPYA